MEKELQDMKRMIGPHMRGSIYDLASGTSSIPMASPSEATAVSGPSALLGKDTLLYLNVPLQEKSLEGVSIDAYLIKDLLEK